MFDHIITKLMVGNKFEQSVTKYTDEFLDGLAQFWNCPLSNLGISRCEFEVGQR